MSTAGARSTAAKAEALAACSFQSAIDEIRARGLAKSDAPTVTSCLAALSKWTGSLDAPTLRVALAALAVAYSDEAHALLPPLCGERVNAQLISVAARTGQIEAVTRLTAALLTALHRHGKLPAPPPLQRCCSSDEGVCEVELAALHTLAPTPTTGHTTELARLFLVLTHGVVHCLTASGSVSWDALSRWVLKASVWASSIIKVASTALQSPASDTKVKAAARDALLAVHAFQAGVHDACMAAAQRIDTDVAGVEKRLDALSCRLAGLLCLCSTVACRAGPSASTDERWGDPAAQMQYVFSCSRSAVTYAVTQITTTCGEDQRALRAHVVAAHAMCADLQASIRKQLTASMLTPTVAVGFWEWTQTWCTLCGQVNDEDATAQAYKFAVGVLQTGLDAATEPAASAALRCVMMGCHIAASSNLLLQSSEQCARLETRLIKGLPASSDHMEAEDDAAERVATAAGHVRAAFSLASKLNVEDVAASDALVAMYSWATETCAQIHDHLISQLPLLASGAVKPFGESARSRRAGSASSAVGATPSVARNQSVTATPALGARPPLNAIPPRAPGRAPVLPEAADVDPAAAEDSENAGAALRTAAKPPRHHAGRGQQLTTPAVHVKDRDAEPAQAAPGRDRAAPAGVLKARAASKSSVDPDCVDCPALTTDWWLLLEQGFNIIVKQVDALVGRLPSASASTLPLRTSASDLLRCCAELRLLRLHTAAMGEPATPTAAMSAWSKYLARLTSLRIVSSSIQHSSDGTPSLLHGEDTQRHFSKAVGYVDSCLQALQAAPSPELSAVFVRCQQLLHNAALVYVVDDAPAMATKGERSWRGEPGLIMIRGCVQGWSAAELMLRAAVQHREAWAEQLVERAQCAPQRILLCRALANQALCCGTVAADFWQQLYALLGLPEAAVLRSLADDGEREQPWAAVLRKVRVHRVLRDVLAAAPPGTDWLTPFRSTFASSSNEAHVRLAALCECFADVSRENSADSEADGADARPDKSAVLSLRLTNVTMSLIHAVLEICADSPYSQVVLRMIAAQVDAVEPVSVALFGQSPDATATVHADRAVDVLQYAQGQFSKHVQAELRRSATYEAAVSAVLSALNAVSSLRARFSRTDVVRWIDDTMLSALSAALRDRRGTSALSDKIKTELAQIWIWAHINGADELCACASQAVHGTVLHARSEVLRAALKLSGASTAHILDVWKAADRVRLLSACTSAVDTAASATSQIVTASCAVHAVLQALQDGAVAWTDGVQLATELATVAAALSGERVTASARAASIAPSSADHSEVWLHVFLLLQTLHDLARFHMLRGDVGRARYALDKAVQTCVVHGVWNMESPTSFAAACVASMAALSIDESLALGGQSAPCLSILRAIRSLEGAAAVAVADLIMVDNGATDAAQRALAQVVSTTLAVESKKSCAVCRARCSELHAHTGDWESVAAAARAWRSRAPAAAAACTSCTMLGRWSIHDTTASADIAVALAVLAGSNVAQRRGDVASSDGTLALSTLQRLLKWPGVVFATAARLRQAQREAAAAVLAQFPALDPQTEDAHATAVQSVGITLAFRYLHYCIRRRIDFRDDPQVVLRQLVQLARSGLQAPRPASPLQMCVTVARLSGTALIIVNDNGRAVSSLLPTSALTSLRARIVDIHTSAAVGLGASLPGSATSGESDVKTFVEMEDALEEVTAQLEAASLEGVKKGRGKAPSKSTKPSAPAKNSAVTDADKARWWETRFKLDEQLQRVCADMQEALIPPTLLERIQAVLARCAPFKSGSVTSSTDGEDLHALTLVQLKEALTRAGLSDKGAKATLLQRLQDHRSSMHAGSSATHTNMEFFVDETLHGLPWESMPCFRGSSLTVTRRLSAQLPRPAPAERATSSCMSIVVNPAGDLRNTEKRLVPVVDALVAARAGSAVRRHIGAPAPDAEAIIDMLNASTDLFLYCGHGAGESFVTRHAVASRGCVRAPCVLMGCSSARLTASRDWMHDVDGMLAAYVLADSPFVIGNLWDVTDKDIDRYTEAVTQAWAARGGSIDALVSAVSRARDVCKLTHLVGSAPVIYC